jgi:chromatin remodeling complex protein RSC6
LQEESKKDWSKMTVDQLRTELRARGLSATGRKADLVSRLENGGNGDASPATPKRAATPRKAAGKRKQKEADEDDDDDEESGKKEKKSSKDSSDSSSDEEEEEEKKPKAKKSKKTAATVLSTLLVRLFFSLSFLFLLIRSLPRRQPAAAAWVPDEKGNWAPPVTDDDSYGSPHPHHSTLPSYPGSCACRVVSCRVVSCRVVSCRVGSCRVVSCRVVSCRVVRVVSCRVVSCRATRTGNS